MSLTRKPSQVIEVIPTIDTAAYADGDQVGATAQTLQDALPDKAGRGTLESVTIIDENSQDTPLDLLFFGALPATVSGDNDAVDIADAVLKSAKYLGHVSVLAADYIALANSTVATVRNLGMKLEGLAPSDATPRTKDIFVVVVARAAGTYTSTTALKFLYGIDQD